MRRLNHPRLKMKPTFAAVQFAPTANKQENLQIAGQLIEQAKTKGTDLVLLPELFYLPYFPKIKDSRYHDLAESFEHCAALNYMKEIAKKFEILLLVSFFEQTASKNFNSIALINQEGKIVNDVNGKDRYRKTHIPHGPGYEETFYFAPGDTGFSVWETAIGRIGCGICWDQWFPESYRGMAKLDADIICFPTAIGSEPVSLVDTQKRWQRVQQGGAVATTTPVMAANRIGIETDQDVSITFYGTSFIADQAGEIIAEAPRFNQGDQLQSATSIIYANFDFELVRKERANWGMGEYLRSDYC